MKKNIKKFTHLYYKNWFLKNVTKENRLELILDTHQVMYLGRADAVGYAKVADSHGCYAMHHFILNLPTVHLFLAFQTNFLLMKLPDL